MVDELVSVWAWDGGRMCTDLDSIHKIIIRYNMVPHDGMEMPLVDQTATGRRGLRFPTHCFSHFKGMSAQESARVKAHLWSLLNRPEYIYDHHWRDGEIMFMDQNITLHARPTNVTEGDSRTMSRMISYLDRLYPAAAPSSAIRVDGEWIAHDRFAGLVDDQRQREFEAADLAVS